MLQILGAIIPARIFSYLFRKLFKKATAPTRILLAHLLFIVLATIVAGYGNADGGDPKFLESFFIYAFAGLISLSYDFFNELRAKSDNPTVKA